MNFFSNLKLRTKIIGCVVISCTMLVLGGLFAFLNFAHKYEATVMQDTADYSKDLGSKIGAQFFERYGDIQAFAVNPVVRELNANKLTEYLDQYVKLYGIYDVILVVDKNGKFIGSNSVDSDGKKINVDKLKSVNYEGAPWFQASFNEKWVEDTAKNMSGTYFEDIHLDPVYDLAYGTKRSGTTFSTVIKNEKGEKVGVITNRANNRWFETEMAIIYNAYKQSGLPDAEVTLVSKTGVILSNLSPKAHDNKIVFDQDYEKIIFKENVFENHKPVGEKMAKAESGAIISKDVNDPSSDIVGFHYIDNPKWISSIGWTAMVHVDADNAYATVTRAENNYYLISAMIFFIALSLAVWVSVAISKSVDIVTVQLAKNSKEVSEASVKIADQATKLSESSTEQAAALQETVAAVDEISAMVEKNSDAAVKSKEVSGQSREAALKGRQIVENMIQAIGEINSSNDEISTQMDHSNRQMGEITKLINDIGTKTKVINEIVFQTKLLSFNASVEAARAGEYGKGFAVVAEEVGNLAQMSGNAAKEITEMLEQSVRQVENIVAETKTKVERLMVSSKQKVEVGSETAKECNIALEEILANVSSVDALVSEIAVASQEQSTGIREISKAVGQMEEVTQQNSSAAQLSSSESDHLKAQSVDLNEIVQELVRIVRGAGETFKPTNNQASFNSSSPHGQKNYSEKSKPSNLVKFKGKKSTPQSVNVSEVSDNHEAPDIYGPTVPMKKVASGADFTPSSDDPGFE